MNDVVNNLLLTSDSQEFVYTKLDVYTVLLGDLSN